MIPTTGEVVAVELTDEERGIVAQPQWDKLIPPETLKAMDLTGGND